MAYPVQNDQVTLTVQAFEVAIKLNDLLWGLVNRLKISGALVINPITGVIEASNVTDETLQGANAALLEYEVLTVDGRTLTGAEAWREVTAALLSSPSLIPDSFAQFMDMAARHISH